MDAIHPSAPHTKSQTWTAPPCLSGMHSSFPAVSLAIEGNFEAPCHDGGVEMTCSGVACESVARISTAPTACRKNIVPIMLIALMHARKLADSVFCAEADVSIGANQPVDENTIYAVQH